MKTFRRFRRWIVGLFECLTFRCGYYRHYLAYGPADLTHVGYHWAERHCCDAQQRLTDWMETHPEGNVPTHLERSADHWERKVRA